jgi:hypothetical protein
MYMVCSRMYPNLLVEDVAPSQWLNRSDEKIDRLCPDRSQQVHQSTTTLRTVKEAQGIYFTRASCKIAYPFYRIQCSMKHMHKCCRCQIHASFLL